MKVQINIRDTCRVKLSGYGAILYNDYYTKDLSDEARAHYYRNQAVEKGHVLEGTLSYIITALQLGSEGHGFSAIEDGYNGEIEVFEAAW